ncbi:hypothetical protein RV134_70003 [Roseovarius sp. EC-HK134]|uniref:class I SAM-dependent methyltransferase n=1 Tax=unclassified Roseovarius TaxID=2614913 RepID=UPI001255EAD4|nr:MULTISPECIES: class I SAM-dependent methyltransferase [unclassified Roseovarius]VVS96328.1 hypothetical protein RV420_130003 [Roseovarius sp. EC-SD190]VVT34135.1 hypothetical protein RV134_70003 [Roseovarius sp. EC-HK134]
MNLSKKSHETMVSVSTQDFFAPATIKPLFWRPRFRSHSQIQVHAPMLLWLAADVRIQKVCVLGVGDGFAHFLFCQAIDKLNTQGSCAGFGFWKDPKSGEPLTQPPYILSEHAEQFYEDISDIRACRDKSEAIANLVEHSLDLLFIDLDALGERDYPHVEDLIRLLQANGILVVHGTNALWQNADDSIGLAKQLRRLDRLEFNYGAGLSIFPVGEDTSTRVKNLMSVCENGEVPSDIQRVFRRLGQSLVAIEETRNLQSKLAASTKAHAEAQEGLKNKKQELADLHEAYEQRSRKVSQTQSEIFDIKASLSAALAEQKQSEESLAVVQKALETAHAELEAQSQELIAAQDAAREAGMRAEKSESELDAAHAELKAQSQELIAAQDAAREALMRAEKSESDLDAAHAELKAQSQELIAAQDAAREAGVRAEKSESELEETRAELKAQSQELIAAQDAAREAGMRAEKSESELDAAHAELKAQSQELIAAQDAAREALMRAEKSESDLDAAHAELKAQSQELIAAQDAAREAGVRAEKSESELEAARAEQLTIKKTLEGESERAAQLEAKIKTEKRVLEMERTTRFQETAALTRMLEEMRVELNTAVDRRQHEFERAAQLEQKFNEAVAIIETLNFENAELLKSTSWRMTAPMRKIKLAFSKEI